MGVRITEGPLYLQIFGIQLAAHVIHQYPLPETMGVARDIFQRLTVVSREVSAEVRERYFLSVLPSLALLCRTFPPLCSDATTFLVHLTKLVKPETSSSLTPVLPNVRDWGSDVGEGTSEGENSLIKAIKSTFSDLVEFITD